MKRAIAGKKRDPQKARARRVESGAVITLGCQYVSFEGESCFKLSSGNMIPQNGMTFMIGLQGSCTIGVERGLLKDSAR